MPCVDYNTWQAAKAACAARTASVRGLSLYGFRGLGDLNLNTAAAADLSDPCYIASLTPCPTFATPAPYVAPTPGGSATPTTSHSSAVGGFSRWGLLAAIAAGGTALYFVMRKKS